MTKMRTLGEILTQDDNSEELYHTDQQKRRYRASRGRFTKDPHTFDFIHLVKRWEELVGPMLAQNTIPLRIKNSQLYVLTKHAVFSQELSFMEQLLIQKIEDTFTGFKNKIKKIRFVTGNFSSEEFNQFQQKTIEKAPQENKSSAHRFDPHYRQRKAQVSQFFSDIDDPEIQELLVQICLTNKIDINS